MEPKRRKVTYIKRKNSGCWICTSHKANKKNKYPKINVNGKLTTVNRYMYEKYKEKIPQGLVLRHKCDTPLCINPNHLIPGTHKDNVHDMIKRNRTNYCKGIKQANSKLSEKNALDIFNNKKCLTIKEQSKKYKVSTNVIDNIRNGMYWSHVTKNKGDPYKIRKRRYNIAMHKNRKYKNRKKSIPKQDIKKMVL